MRIENVIRQAAGWYHVPLTAEDTKGNECHVEIDAELGLAVINAPEAAFFTMPQEDEDGDDRESE